MSSAFNIPDNDALALRERNLVITLCGSARFERLFKAWNEALTMAGHTVFGLTVYPSDKGGMKQWYSDEQKIALDAAHFRKIEASDAIFVINRDAYIGSSTMNEIAHARRLGRLVYFLESWGEGNGMYPTRSPIDTTTRSGSRDPWAGGLLGPAGALRSSIVELVRAAAAPTPPVDAVPGEPVAPPEWTARRTVDGMCIVIDSADFEHDASLILTGDFATEGEKMSFGGAIADKLNRPAASVASRAGSEPDERMFDLTLECVGRTVDVTFSRPQIDALIARLREFGLLAPIAPAAAAEPSERCAKCGGRDIPWGHGKCHCFKKTKDNDGREQHGADAEGVAQVGGADAGTNRIGARPGANLGDEHRGAEAADHGHAGYSLGEEVRFPSRRELQEGIDLTPEPEDLRAIFPDRERAASLVAAWPESWRHEGYNGAMTVAAEALRYLANNDRPSGGSSSFNAEHLFQVARELDITREKLLASAGEAQS